MWSTVNLPKQGSEVALGVELGKIEAEETPAADLTAELDEVIAIGNAVVEVTFDDDVDAAAAEAAAFVITEKGTSTELEIKDVTAVEADRVFVETASMTTGKAYTMTLGEKAINFTGLAKEADKPEVDSVKGTDTNTVEVEFDMVMDMATAEDIANYSIDKIGTVTAAKLDDDNKTVVLTVEGFTKTQSAKLTVENVLSVDGVAMSKATNTFYATFDKASPKLEEVYQDDNNNVEVILFFEDDHGVDEETAEDVSNYSIEGLDILKAVADDEEYDSSAADKSAATDDGYLRKVTLTTSEQKKGTKYTVKVLNMVDGSTAKNAISSELSDTFRGGEEDDNAPELKSTGFEPLSLTMVAVNFDEANLLDPASALDISNYSVQKDELDILDAQFKDDDDEETIIWLTVSEMDEDAKYKFYVNNVADEFGNAMDDEESDTIDTDDIVTDAPTYIESVEVVDMETVKVTFAQAVTEATMEDPTNYSVDGDVGTALTAEADSSTVVELTFNEMDGNESYKITINGVETFAGYATENSMFSFIATTDELDTTKPEVEAVDNDDQGILKVEFSEEMDITALTSYVEVKDQDTSTTYYLPATTTTGDDDEIVVFRATTAYTDTALSAGLTNLETLGNDFDIVAFSDDIMDLAGNAVDYSDGEEFDTDSTYTASDFTEEYQDTDQTDVVTLTIEYDTDVMELSTSAGTVTLTGADTGAVSFDVDDVDGSTVTLQYTAKNESPFDDEEVVTFTLNAVVGDLIERAVSTQTIEVEWDSDDDTAPEIVEVTALDSKTIVIEYDENISSDDLGTYKVVEADDEDEKLSVDRVKAHDDDDDKVVVILSDAMESSKYYTLTQSSLAEDIAGNDAEEVEDGIDFLGSSTPYVENTIDGVTLISGTKLEIKDNYDLPEGTYVVYSGSAAAGNEILTFAFTGLANGDTVDATNSVTGADVDSSDADTLVVTVPEYYAFHEEQTYVVKVTVEDTADADTTTLNDEETQNFSESFSGIVEVLEVESASATTEVVTVNSLDEDEDQIVTVYINGTGEVVYSTAASTDNQDDEELTTSGLDANDVVVVVVTDAKTDAVLQITEGALAK
jgi:ribosome-associated translation inhibitor RaiA